MSPVTIRSWQPADATTIDSLLDPDPDPHWLRERRGRHGITARPDRFALTAVAEDDSGVVGMATMHHNHYHPGRYPAIVEVAPDRRREGIGRLLVTALGAHRPAPRPLAVKLRDANRTAMHFAAALGMRAYQHCPGVTLDPTDRAVQTWAGDQAPPLGADLVALDSVQPQQAAVAAVDYYSWVHQHWSPMGDRDRIVALWSQFVKDADRQLASLAVVADRIAAICLVWVEDGNAEAIAETAARDQPYGTELAAACVARSLSRLGKAGVAGIQFDGHDDDPHLTPVMNAIPNVRRDPVSLLELSP